MLASRRYAAELHPNPHLFIKIMREKVATQVSESPSCLLKKKTTVKNLNTHEQYAKPKQIIGTSQNYIPDGSDQTTSTQDTCMVCWCVGGSRESTRLNATETPQALPECWGITQGPTLVQVQGSCDGRKTGESSKLTSQSPFQSPGQEVR